MIVDGFVYVVPVVMLTAIAYQWYVTIRVYGGSTLRVMRQVARLVTATRLVGWLLAGISMLVALSVTWGIFSDFSPPVPLLIGALTTSLSIVLIVIRPPVALFLACSRPDSIALFRTIRASLGGSGMRAVALLDFERTADNDLRELPVHLMDSFRTGESERWKTVVESLAELVPVIVVDTRIVTPLVFEEMQRLTASRLWQKTLFVVSDRGYSGALNRLVTTVNQTQLLTARATDCNAAIHSIVETRSRGRRARATN